MACAAEGVYPSPRASETKAAILSTESIPSAPLAAHVAESCAACDAPLADDQRYCLECGERRFPMSSVLLGGSPSGVLTQPATPPAAPPPNGAGRGGAVTVIAGVGVLLLAMGVGVLIGRSGASKPSAAAPQVISVASSPSGAGASTGSFTSDWPAGTNGYTVRLQTLPQSSTQVSAVEAAKAAASAKGAAGVGALKSEEFTSLTAGSYVIYAGVDHSKAEAEKALAGLKKSFPAAAVIAVSNGGSSSSASGSGSSASGSSSGKSGAGSSESHPAPPSVLQNLSKKKGKNYEQESKNLPNVISTG
jgi:hypothetical protein